MTAEFARAEWERAVDALRDARLLIVHGGFDSAASCAYYAIFHAVTALFAIEGRTFAKHSAIAAAVHKDLVKPGRWPIDLGRDFTFCAELRGVGDYGTDVRVDQVQASEAVASANRILLAVRDGLPSDYALSQTD